MEFSFKDYLKSIKPKNDEKDSPRKTNTRKLRQFILIVCEGTNWTLDIGELGNLVLGKLFFIK